MATLPIALQLYSVRDALEQDFVGTLEKVKAFGYDGVEFAGLYGHSAEEVRAMCEKIGLVPISAHVPFADMVEDPAGVLGEYKKLCPYVVVPYMPEEKRPGTDGFAQTLKEIELVGKMAKKLGMVLLYHNHDFEFVKVDGKYGLDILYDTIPADLLQTELDTCWINVGGEDPVAYIRKYTGRAPIVHLKDFVGGKSEGAALYELIGIDSDAKKAAAEAFSFRPIGQGVQNFPEILKATKDAGASWVVVEQDRPAPGGESMESAKQSIDYLRSFDW